ncbi:hypothetical protein [Tritonibacter mobilis]|uniref:hypothetical protein n=1 Tax=Tritonibacter mobilis TaxID=379347 RepID=UPI000806E590|nr:hypothetical protein [Tritonibacter mobilis]
MTRWVILSALTLAAASTYLGYQRGKADCVATYNARELEMVEAGRKLDAARIELERERYTLSRQLEEKAYADPVSVPQCLGPKRVLRLNSLR